MKSRLPVSFALVLSLAGACTPAPSEPVNPTWADIEPITVGECASCHGPTAAQTGGGYRLDLFDMTKEVCGDAAQALMPGTLLAGGAAPLIGADVTPPTTGGRSRMPPAPGPSLTDWERGALQRWAVQPSKGPPPQNNQPPTIEFGQLPAVADNRLQFTLVTRDPDNDPVVGVLEIANVVYAMDRSGAFSVDLDTSTWPSGPQNLNAVLCDGWTNVTIHLGPISITH
jgi:hypothetical protein